MVFAFKMTDFVIKMTDQQARETQADRSRHEEVPQICEIIGHFLIENHHFSGEIPTSSLHFRSIIPKESRDFCWNSYVKYKFLTLAVCMKVIIFGYKIHHFKYTKSIIINTKFIILNTKFIVLNVKSIILNTNSIICKTKSLPIWVQADLLLPEQRVRRAVLHHLNAKFIICKYTIHHH